MTRKDDIKKFWDDQAKERKTNPNATTNDIFIRELEINTLIQTINELGLRTGNVLDVGCGNGYSTLKIASSLTELNFLGIDYSENMIEMAKNNLENKAELKSRLQFKVGDVTNLDASCGTTTFDLIISDRSLINVETEEMQDHAIKEIARHTKNGGYYIAIENFMEGQDNMNNARNKMGLQDIPLWWMSTYFTEPRFKASAERFFENVEFRDFASSYYFATKILYSATCKLNGVEPDYNHAIHQLAIHLPWTGQFSPIRMVIMKKKS